MVTFTTWIIESLGLEKTSKISSPIATYHQYCPLNHAPGYYIYPFLKHLQGWWTLWAPVIMSHHSYWEEILPIIQPEIIMQNQNTFKQSTSNETLAQLPRELWVPHAWRCWRLGWMEPGAAWAGGGQPAHRQGWNGWVLRSPFQPKPLYVAYIE